MSFPLCTPLCCGLPPRAYNSSLRDLNNISPVLIRIDCRTFSYCFLYHVLKRYTADWFCYLHFNFSASFFPDCYNWGFILQSLPCEVSLTCVCYGISRPCKSHPLSYRRNELSVLLTVIGFSYPVSEKPSRFLHYIKIPGEFHIGHAFQVRIEQVDSHKPFMKRYIAFR